jgi:hypothetical protein
MIASAALLSCGVQFGTLPAPTLAGSGSQFHSQTPCSDALPSCCQALKKAL